VFAFVLFAALLVALSEAHICLINPVQVHCYILFCPFFSIRSPSSDNFTNFYFYFYF
jgi:hypothetical protein